MEDLLADALADFEEEESLPPADQALREGDAATTVRVSDASGGASASKPEPPSRGPSLPPKTKRTRPRPLPFDPLKQGAPRAELSSETTADQDASPSCRGPLLPPRPSKSKQQLPADVQALADDLLKLMEETGFGGAGNSTTDALPGASHSHADPSSATSSHAAPESSSVSSESFRSAALQGLSEHTKRTVSKQSKFQRGEGEAHGGGAMAGQAGSGGSGFGALGDLLNALGPAGEAGMDSADGAGGGMGLMVDYIMQNLLSKEVLYGPLKDICDKYPPWLEANREAMSPDELARYTAQYTSIQAVCKQYEDDPSDFQRLVALIQQMQTYGDPPSEIVDEMTGGVPADLMGEPGESDNIGNFDLPPNFAADLPQELQDKCAVQ